MEWPVLYSHFKHQENVQDILNRPVCVYIKSTQFKPMAYLKVAITDAWDNIYVTVFERLINGMLHGIFDDINKHCGYIG